MVRVQELEPKGAKMDEKTDTDITLTLAERVQLFNTLFTRRGERGKCNWVPVEGTNSRKCTTCGDYDLGDDAFDDDLAQ